MRTPARALYLSQQAWGKTASSGIGVGVDAHGIGSIYCLTHAGQRALRLMMKEHQFVSLVDHLKTQAMHHANKEALRRSAAAVAQFALNAQ